MGPLPGSRYCPVTDPIPEAFLALLWALLNDPDPDAAIARSVAPPVAAAPWGPPPPTTGGLPIAAADSRPRVESVSPQTNIPGQCFAYGHTQGESSKARCSKGFPRCVRFGGFPK